MLELMFVEDTFVTLYEFPAILGDRVYVRETRIHLGPPNQDYVRYLSLPEAAGAVAALLADEPQDGGREAA